MKISVVLSIGFACLLSGILSLMSHVAMGQTVNRCGIEVATAKLLAAYPEDIEQINKANADLEEETQAKILQQNQKMGACNTVKVIPVVFHIIHENGPENIPDQYIFDAIRILNEDFRLWNEDTVDVLSVFKPLMGEALIEFRLAKLDPSGNPTDGIDRIQSSETNIGDDGSKLNPWPRNSYLNIWTVKVNPDGAAAYAYLPASVAFGGASVDGIIARYIYVGEGERTLTHEVGHWINLLHVWGTGNDAGNSGNCTLDDNVSDTPDCIGTPGGCDLNRTTCSSLDMVQNYMDYALCERLFTAGQVVRMRAALSSSIAQRSSLTTIANLVATGLYDGGAEFTADLTKVCIGADVSFTDMSYNGVCEWEWSFEGGTPNFSSDRLATVVYDYPGTYSVSLTVSNDTGSASTTMVDYINVVTAETLPYSEDFAGSSDWEVSGSGGPGWVYTSFTYDGSPGSVAIYNFNTGLIGDIDEIVSPPIDLSVMLTAEITFKVAYAQVDFGTNDLLKVYTSGDCGVTWSSVWVSGGVALSSPNGQLTSNFIPSNLNDWKDITVSVIPSSLTENFRFKFEFTSDAGNNIFIDNINIGGTFSETPILVSPVNYAEDEPTALIMDWNAVLGVDFYDYRIDTAYTMDSPFLITGSNAYLGSNDNSADTEYSISGLDSAMTIYWSVRTRNGPDTSAWSSIWRFRTMVSVPVIPLQISPTDWAVNQPTTVTINWNAVDGISFYDYQIDTAITMDSPFLVSGTTTFINNQDNGLDTKYTITGLDSGMVLHWNVRTRTAFASSNWSPIWTFVTTNTVDGISMEDQLKSHLSIFPNPSNGDITIGFDLDKVYANVSVQFFDLLGREIMTLSQDLNQLSAGHHEVKVSQIQDAGVYFVRLNLDAFYIHSRFIITK